MGRLPATFANQEIKARQPWSTFGEKIVTSGQANQLYADALFQNSTDKPFEIHRLVPRCLALDVNGTALITQPDQDLLQSLVRITIKDLGKDTNLLKTATPLTTLVKGTAERTWEWAEPYYLVKSEQFQVQVTAATFPAFDLAVAQLAVWLNFEGFFIVVAPPGSGR